jgi:uncharacterized damage-inducible protein DinB
MSVLEVVRRLHVYNQWANEQIIAAMDGMTADDLMAEAPVAYGHLRGASWHTVAAQMGWLRIVGQIDTWSRVPVRDSSSVDGLREMFDGSHELWREYIASLSEEGVLSGIELPMDQNFLSSVGPVLNWSKEHGHRPLRPMWQSILHVVNHGTQHRAEIGIHLASLGRSPDDMDYGTFEEYRAVHDDAEHLGAIK